MRSRILMAVVSAGAAALVAAGCGGGSSDDAPKPLAHADLVRQADAACTQASRRVRALEAPTALSGLQEYATSVKTIGEDLEKRLQELTPNAQDRDKVNAYRGALRQSNNVAGQLAQAAGSGDRTAVRSLSDHLAESNIGVLAAQAGLAQCATAVTLTGT